MWKFIAGVAIGAVLALGYVRFNLQLPGFLQLPDILRGNIISTATETELYDLDAPSDIRRRALEIYFANRAGDAALIDAEAGHPFLAALHRARASRDARRLSMEWAAYDEALALPNLRETLERRHNVTDTLTLKRAMLWASLEENAWMAAWLEQHYGRQSPETLLDTLHDARRYPGATPASP